MERGHLTAGKPVPGMPGRGQQPMPSWFRFYLNGLGFAEAEALLGWLDQEPLAASVSAMTAALRQPRQPQASTKIQEEGRRRG